MAELASAAPTSGGLYYWTYIYSTPKWRNLLSWITGCELDLSVCDVRLLISIQIQTPSVVLQLCPPLTGAARSKSWPPPALDLV